MSQSKTSSLLAAGLFLACSLLTSQAALLIHYSFDGEAPGSLSTGEVIANLGTSGTNGTVGIPSGSITVSADANRVNGVAGELGNYLNFQPGADANEGVGSTHITSGSSLSSLGIDGNTSYSMMAWVKFDNSLNDNMVFGGNSGSVLHLGARGNSYWSGHWGDDINSGGSPTIDAGNWHHVTWTNSGTTQEIFIDGASVATGGGGSSGGFSGNLSENLLIGTSRNQGSFRGSLDDVAVFSTLLNDSQIAAFHTLSTNVDYGYNAGEVDQMITAHQAGAGSSVAVGDTTWEYVVSDPADGRYFIQLDSGGSGLAGSTGPPVREFSVDHPLIPAGNPIVLSWDVGINATSLSIDQGVGDILPLTTGGIGQITLNPGPSSATTYTITASNADGANMAQVTVNITNQPIIESFTADQILVAPGTSVQLDWSTLNVTALDLNGSNVNGTTSLTVNPTTTTTYTLSATNGQGVNTSQLTVTVIIPGEPVINEVSATNQSILLDEDGESTDWIELHNPSGTTAILNDYYLSDDPSLPTKWRLPNMNLAPGGFLMIFASGKDRAVAGSELHTNFSLQAGGEYLALSKVDGGVTTFLSEFNPYPNQFEDITWGYFPDGNTLGYFTTPTPASTNLTGAIDYVRDTSFSLNRGFYTVPISVTISSNTPFVDIRYTTDGSAPTTTTGILYTGPIGISSTTVLRAIAYRTGYLPTNVDTNTYIFLDDVITQSETAPTGWPASGTFNGQLYNYGMDSDIVNSGNSAIGGVQEVKDALSVIPSISISLKQDDFSGGSGIFSNPGNRGIAWERPASAELIFPTGYVDPDGNLEGFQIDAGLRVRGGFSRSGSNPKHALRLFFRAEYGDSKLRFPIFGDEGVDEFDNLDLRTSQNYSWAFQNDANRNTFLREVFSRDTQRDMGQPYTRSRYYHIYINGIYWGLYMTQERAEASYAETYFGGDKANYDTVKSAGSSGGYTNEATDGNLDAWQDIFDMGRNLVDPGFVNKRAEYYKMQGLDSNGVRDTNLPVLIDMDNLIDFMLVTFWVGNFDAPLSNFLGNDRPNNFFSLRDRTNNDIGFAFYAHDAEHSLFSGWDRTGPFNSSNRAVFAYSNPQFLHEDLLQNLDSFSSNEYFMAWADRTHKAFFNDGVLTTASATARINSRASIVDQVIVAESARWGDAKGANPPHDRNDWIGAKNSLLSIAGGRNSTVLGQLVADGLYPTLAAPGFSQHGGHISSVTPLTITNASGEIYYTTDGSDPRLIGGGIHTSATLYTGPLLLTTTNPVRARSYDTGTWSALNEATFIVDAVVASSSNLVVSEVHYRPAAPTPAEEDAGFLERSVFEFLEVMNIGPNEVDMTNVRFTDGVEFNFDNSLQGITLAPGQRFILVSNIDAFQIRYPGVSSSLIAGEFSGSLSNGGEQITLQASDNSVVRGFTYDDKSPWPESPDGDGFSLTLIDPGGGPDHADPFSWRASVTIGGSPTGSDASSFSGNALDDLDGDGLKALIEYLLGSSDTVPSGAAGPTVAAQNLIVDTVADDYLTMTVVLDLSADDVEYQVEITDDLAVWESGSGHVVHVSSTNNGDGTLTVVYRSADPIVAGIQEYFRLRVISRS